MASFYLHQKFSIPDSIIYYVNINPSEKAYEKMIKSCKYFFNKNPILILKGLKIDDDLWKSIPLCSKLQKQFLHSSCKLWIQKILVISSTEPGIASQIIKKLYRYDICEIFIAEQVISFHEILLFSPTVKRLSLSSVTVNGPNNTKMSFEKIIPFLKLARSFRYEFTFIETNSATFANSENKLVNILNASNLTDFKLYNAPQCFKIEKFSLKVVQNKRLKIWLIFGRPTVYNELKRFKVILDEILANKNLDFVPPIIVFGRHNVDDVKKVLIKRNKFLRQLKPS